MLALLATPRPYGLPDTDHATTWSALGSRSTTGALFSESAVDCDPLIWNSPCLLNLWQWPRALEDNEL